MEININENFRHRIDNLLPKLPDPKPIEGTECLLNYCSIKGYENNLKANAEVARTGSVPGASSEYVASMIRDPSIDSRLKQDLDRNSASFVTYQMMQKFRENLPAFKCRSEILSLIEKNQVLQN